MKRLIDMTEEEMTVYFSGIAEMIESVLPGEAEPGKGHNGHALFMLVVFDDPGLAQYVSNCDRKTMVAAMRETAGRFEAKEVIERGAPDGLGATGEFPAGKLHEHDEGELTYAVGSDKRIGKVMLTFGKPVAWMGFRPKEALELSDALRWHATKIGE